MERNRFAFLGLRPTNRRLAKCAHELFPDVERVAFSSETLILDSLASTNLITKKAAAPAEAVRQASHVFVDSAYGRALTYLQDAAPELTHHTSVFDCLPIKDPIREHLKETADLDRPYVGGHWLNPNDEADPFLALASDEYASLDDLQDDDATLARLIETFAEASFWFKVDAHDSFVARRIQLPSLASLRSTADDPDALPEKLLDQIWESRTVGTSHPALQFESLVANQSHLLDQLSELTTHLQKVRNRLFSEDRSFFEDRE